jgi:site-specific recombinase XerD
MTGEHKRFPHALKHTCGIQMRRSGATLETIQNALGHKRLDSTAMYLRVTQDEVDDARSKAFAAAGA